MESSQASKHLKEVDRISNLPDVTINQIISYLPITDAVQTSLLSSKWRFKWAINPNLVFDIQSCPCSSDYRPLKRRKLVNIVDRVLLLHLGSIDKFKLSHDKIRACSDINRWILHISRNSIKEFVLEIWNGQPYKIPTTLYNFRELHHLQLLNCMLKPPSSVGGFQGLRTLVLQRIEMTQTTFEKLIAGCPLLKRLTLHNFEGFSQLNIRAPNLQFLDVKGDFDEVTFEDSFQLSVILLFFDRVVTIDHSVDHVCHFTKFFSHLPSIERLEMICYTLKYVAVGHIPEELPTPCLNLKDLYLEINFNDRKESLAALCLLRSSPNLTKLGIMCSSEENSQNTCLSIDLYQRKCSFNKLQAITVSNVSDSRTELEFIKFMLANSPVLEKMMVRPVPDSEKWELVKQMLQFRRASDRAEITYLDPCL